LRRDAARVQNTVSAEAEGVAEQRADIDEATALASGTIAFLLRVLPARRRPLVLVALAGAIDLLVVVLLLRLSPDQYLAGVPGTVFTITTLLAGLLGGPLAGVPAAVLGTGLFAWLLHQYDRLPTGAALVGSGLLWVVIGLLGGLLSDALRMQFERREARLRQDQVEATRHSGDLSRMLEVAAAMIRETEPRRLPGAICRYGAKLFGANVASLYRLEGRQLSVLSRYPPDPTLSPGTIFDLQADEELSAILPLRGPNFITDFPLEGKSERIRALIRHPGVDSVLTIPLRVGDKVDTILLLGWRERREAPDERSLAIMQGFGDQAAQALAHGDALELHARLQMGLMPQHPIDIPGLGLVMRFWPEEHRLLFGGDFFGVVGLPGGIVQVVMGDVSGHGPNAAALGATLRASWRVLASVDTDLGTTLRILHQVLLWDRDSEGVFATLFAARLDLERSRLTFVNLGHPPPVLVGAEAQLLPSRPAPPLGFVDTEEWSSHQEHVDLPEGWRLFLYTDGLFEGRIARYSRERLGLDRLLQRVTERPLLDAAAVDELYEFVSNANGGPMPDDVAVLVLSAEPEPAATQDPEEAVEPATDETGPDADLRAAGPPAEPAVF